MGIRCRLTPWAFVCFLVASCLPAPARAAAPAYPTTLLPLRAAFDMEVDDLGRRVFVSSGQTGSRVAIVDFEGHVTGTLGPISGPTGMEIVGTVLYVAAYGAARIERFDLTSSPPTRLEPLSTLPFVFPRDLVLSASRIWFSTGCDTKGEGRIGGVEIATGVVSGLSHRGSWTYCPRIDGGPYGDGLLFAWPLGITTTTYEYDVTTSPQTEVHSEFAWYAGDVLPMPNGSTFLTGSCSEANGRLGINEYLRSDFSGPVFTYTSDICFADAIDLTMSGPTLLAGIGKYTDEPEVWLYRVGVAAPFRTVDLPPDPRSSGTSVYPRGLAVSDDASRVFALTDHGEPPVLHTIDLGREPSGLSLSVSQSTVSAGDAVEVHAQLQPPVAGENVTIYSTDASGDRQVAAEGETDSNGRLSFTAHPQAELSFDARYTGSSTFTASVSETRTVQVRTTTSLELAGQSGSSDRFALYREGIPVQLRAEVGPDHDGYAVHFELWRRRDEIWRPFGKPIRVVLGADSDALLQLDDLARARYRTRVRIHEHDDHLGSVSRYAYFKVVRAGAR